MWTTGLIQISQAKEESEEDQILSTTDVNISPSFSDFERKQHQADI